MEQSRDEDWSAVPRTAPVPNRDEELAADAALFDQLVKSRFTGPTWSTASNVIGDYCFAVLAAWIPTGQIFVRCDAEGYVLQRPAYPLAPQEVQDLAADTVVSALNTFRRRALAGSGWRPDGGRALKSWIVTDCVVAFPNVWRAHRRRLGLASRAEATEMLLDPLENDLRTAPSAEEIALQRAQLREVLSPPDEELRHALQYLALGYSQAETVELVGGTLTVRALEGRLRRHRQKLDEERRL